MIGTKLRLAIAWTVLSLVGVGGAFAGPDFIRRPTQPYDCKALAGVPGVWQGFFDGRKEADWGGEHYENAYQQPCFRSEKDCRNWLYNMQSEYNEFIWSATCKKVGK